ncbi:MAG TPA: RluA family pseudouridine synthase [Candidatus Binataceae bacterium]|nr:RluA family pseudouridine synthase [Candidatus Binataceae bacterium]
MTARTLTVGSAPGRMRLDVFVAAELGAEFSRSQAARMIKAGLVRLNGAPARAADAVRAGDTVEIQRPCATPTASAAHVADAVRAAPEIDVLYADDEIVVVNKPAGMTVHPAPGHPCGTLIDALLARFPEMAAMVEPDGVMRPGIVHRLDKDTSGVMVVARTPFARMELARQFKQRTVGKIYLAVVRGLIGRERFSIARPVGRHPVERKRMSVASRHGRAAVSEVCVLARMPAAGADATLLAVRPLTGRTHQIRVHLASIGHPCLGDPLYGGRHVKPSDATCWFNRQALHALALRLSHPRTAAALEFVAPPPGDLAGLLAARGVATERTVLERWIELVELGSRPLGERTEKWPVDSPKRLR